MKFLLGVLALVLLVDARVSDWSQWRGPNRNGISSEKVN